MRIFLTAGGINLEIGFEYEKKAPARERGRAGASGERGMKLYRLHIEGGVLLKEERGTNG